MKFLIRLQREGWYFAGFKSHSGKAEIGRIQNAKVYNSRGEAMGDLSRMGEYGQRIIAITQIGCPNPNGIKINPNNSSRKRSRMEH